MQPMQLVAANATGTAGGETTVVMPLGSSASTSGAGYEPAPVTVSPGAQWYGITRQCTPHSNFW